MTSISPHPVQGQHPPHRYHSIWQDHLWLITASALLEKPNYDNYTEARVQHEGIFPEALPNCTHLGHALGISTDVEDALRLWPLYEQRRHQGCLPRYVVLHIVLLLALPGESHKELIYGATLFILLKLLLVDVVLLPIAAAKEEVCWAQLPPCV